MGLVYLLVGLCLLSLTLLVILVGKLNRSVESLDDAVRYRVMMPNIGGRMPPSVQELSAAKNRMDALGVAHPGKPDG